MKRRHILPFIGGLALAIAMPVMSAQALELKLLSSWVPNTPGPGEVENFIVQRVMEATNGEITFKRSGPEAVPPFEVLQPAGAGLFDVLVTHSAYHAGTTAIGMALEGTIGDPAKRRETGVWDFVSNHYKKFGLMPISLAPEGKTGAYQIVLRNPVGPSGDFAGLKIRGTATYHPLINALGGSPVVIAPADVYTSLQKGVVDGAAWPKIGILDMKWEEVAKHYLRPGFGISTVQVFMNTESFNKLSPEHQKIILDAGREAEAMLWDAFEGMADKELAGMQAGGMQETNVSAEHSAKLGAYFADGLWAMAMDKNGDDAKAFRKLVEEKNMLP